MWTLILDAMFRSFITQGALRVVYPDGQARLFGEGDAPVQIRLQTDNLPKNLVLRTDLALGEAYMNVPWRLLTMILMVSWLWLQSISRAQEGCGGAMRS